MELQPEVKVRATVEKRKVVSSLSKGERQTLARFGGAVRARARRKIKKAKRSRPFGPPGGHVGLLKNKTFFALDDGKVSVVIGPEKVKGKDADALEMIEKGGTTTRVVFGKKKRVKYEARPFMKPAYDEAIKQDLPKILVSVGR